jgi:Immunity protein 10
MKDFWLVGFADDKFKTRDYLTLQRGFEDDEQDVALGMDTYHVERNDQKWSGYGEIAAFELKRDRVKVRFSAKGAARMGATEIEVSFQIDDDEYSELKDRLGKIFEGADLPFRITAEQ